jgi:hypothetical protein
MIIYTPMSPLEAAILESGRFELATDTAGREVLCVGHRRLPKIVLQQKSDGLHDLIEAVGATGGRAFEVIEGDPWQIEEAEPDGSPGPLSAEEHLVMGLRPMKSDGRPVRVATTRDVVRLFLLPWSVPAKTLTFGGKPHYVVTSSRGVVGDWNSDPDGRVGVVVGVPEIWVGILERHHAIGSSLAFRCDVPVPWVGDSGVANASPTMIGVYESPGGLGVNGNGSGPVPGGSWIATLPVVMTEGTVVQPVQLPVDVEIEAVTDGPWELEWQDSSEFTLESLN